MSDGITGGTTSHLTRLSKNDSQVIGYSHSTEETTSHPTKQPKDGCQVVGYKPASGQVPPQGVRRDCKGLKPQQYTQAGYRYASYHVKGNQ